MRLWWFYAFHQIPFCGSGWRAPMSFLVVLALSIFVAVKLLAYFYRVAVLLSVFYSYRFFSALY